MAGTAVRKGENDVDEQASAPGLFDDLRDK
jgi:hypothetical protein